LSKENIMVRNDPFVNTIQRLLRDDASHPVAREWRSASRGLPVDIYAHQDGYTIIALAPGLSADQLSVEAQGNIVKISGETGAPSQFAAAQATRLRSEISFGKFSRSFELPDEIDADKIEARLEKGLLTVFVPKAAAVKPRSIKVEAK
jgi:HSP20 family protein